MSIPAIAPSPVARLLLELEARKATGGLSVGGRRMVLTDGAIVEVRPHAEDTSLGEFLVATGRLSDEQLEQAKNEASSRRQPLEVVLRQQDLVPMDVLLESRRALWLDRFVRGIAAEEESGLQPGLLTPEPHPSGGPAISTLSFVLDGLTRRAGFDRDAERVGKLSQAWFEWLDTPQKTRAAQWADLGEISSATLAGALFPRHPAAPSRIAALVRAGLARLSERRSQVPPPAPRNPGFAGPSPSQRPEPPVTGITRALSQPLSPGRSRAEEPPLDILPVPAWLPPASGELDDPLDALERKIAQLEQSEAPAAQRCRAWLDLAQAFLSHFDAIDEAARASREAASADPSSTEALDLAAKLCSAIGQPELAHAYAAALAAALTDPASAALAHVRAAAYAARANKPGTALRALRHAAELRPEDPLLAERYARALMARGEVEPALRAALGAAEQQRTTRPEAARALLSWAHECASDATVASELASLLSAEGFAEAAIAHIARAARAASGHDTARRLWLHADVRAEVAARPDLAADLLLEALAHAPDETAYHAPLFEALNSAGQTLELAVLATELSLRFSGETRSALLLRAAEARLELPGDPSLALELCVACLAEDPHNERALFLLEQLAGSLSRPHAATDALERAVVSCRKPEATRGLLARLAQLALETSQPALQAWATTQLEHMAGLPEGSAREATLERRLRAFERGTEQLEAALWETRPNQRSAVAVELADRLRHAPNQRSKARRIYEKVLEREPHNAAAEAGLEALLRLAGDTEALANLLERRAHGLIAGPQRAGAWLSLIHLHWAHGQLESAAQAAQALLAEAPRHREALLILSHLAGALGAEALERDAMLRRADSATDPRARARLLANLARRYALLGELDEATRWAEIALGADPRCAEAALLLVDHHAQLDPPRRVSALRAARAVLGDTPRLLRLLAQACFGTHDARGQLEALEAWLRLSPLDPLPALGLTSLRATGKDTLALREAVGQLIAPDRLCDETAAVAKTALSRLWALGAKREATELALNVADALGEAGAEIVAWALPMVRESDDPHLSRAVLERIVARARGDERRAELRRLAQLCRSRGERAAEARVHLRLLAVEPQDSAALERLAHLYAETRELERLTAVLTLRLNLARTADERRERLLWLACASLSLLDDPGAAVDLVRAALAPERKGDAVLDVPLADLRRGVGLLLSGKTPHHAFDLLLELSEEASSERARALLEEAIFVAEDHLHDSELALRAATLGLEAHPFHAPFLLHFERLSLELHDVATGREVYRHLADAAMGSHGRRAILYRAARFLERSGALQDALEMAELAFALDPSEGAVLAAIERYAQATSQPEALLRALTTLAAHALNDQRRAEVLLRAALLAEEALVDLPEALRLHVRALEAVLSEAHLAGALRTLARLAEQDLGRARAEAETLREVLSRKARGEEPDATRIFALTALGELALDLFENPEDASSYAAAATQLADHPSEAADPSELERLKARLTQLVGRLPKRRSSRPFEPRPENDVAPQAQPPAPMSAPAEVPGSVKWPEPIRSFARPSSRDTLQPALAAAPSAPAPTDDPRSGVPSLRGPALELVSPRRSLRVEPGNDALSSEEDALVRAIAGGDPEALTKLGESFASTSIEYNAKLCDALLVRARKHNLNLVAIRGLWSLSERAHRRDVRAVTSELLSHFDPSIACTRTGRIPDPQDDVTRAALLEARDDGPLSPMFTVLGHLFLAGGPLFRRPLANFGVSASDFIGPRDDNPFAEALREVSSVLGVEHEAYLTPSGRDAVYVAPTYPPSVIIGDGTAQAPIALRYRLGVAFEQARPSSVLLTALPQDAMRTVLAALSAAFGAADAAAEPIKRDAAAMASELWRTLPNATQRQISNVLLNLPKDALAYGPLLDQMRLRAARVGLVTSGALDVALKHLEIDEASSSSFLLSEAGLAAAIAERPQLERLLSFVLSDAYLALRSRESS